MRAKHPAMTLFHSLFHPCKLLELELELELPLKPPCSSLAVEVEVEVEVEVKGQKSALSTKALRSEGRRS